jgi:hypothetical protein
MTVAGRAAIILNIPQLHPTILSSGITDLRIRAIGWEQGVNIRRDPLLNWSLRNEKAGI